ncbi:hypothetical protein DCAR_0626456 [Daucus carota subsp. sativus]|uniref:Uncharacterized protein n=1 Tax=Daucus carota subsp. sativus TaxID=79200 RepID=A0A161YHK3_DAUCS|nr:hypothetical protein DCAR_0626456 [Daucus carota subsp. sativus]
MMDFCFSEEEANELCRTLEDNEEISRTASGMVDVPYHAMISYSVREETMEEDLTIFPQIFSRSGIGEKRADCKEAVVNMFFRKIIKEIVDRT